MFAFVSLLALVASVVALQVTQPSNSSGWTTSGPNTITWSSVSSDKSNFTIVLNNQESYPEYNEVLESSVETSKDSVTVNPPSGGWVAGAGYRINFVQDADSLNTIYAQSNDFTIEDSSSSTFSSSSSTGSVSVSKTSGHSATSTSDSSSGSATDSSSGGEPTTSSNAASTLGVQAGLYGLLAFLGIALA
ncbi:Ser-Thr-rich glycosyl-phosphatidyl-inositol-anchored membrane family-domain-containing protein [Fomitopsis betulina]|nr:Ser-Thr-rich glycosyl-phosphatidyl-inositol-anchored membrane family-domain-containing protein [Fomitopsis betulina]